MKILTLSILFICNTLPAQTSFAQTHRNQLDYFKSNINDLRDENGNSISNFTIPDSLVLTGESTGNDFGCSVSAAGDVNGDGFSDVIVGACQWNSGKGIAYIFYGGLIMNNIADVTMTGEDYNNYFGYSVSDAGDVNGDGFSDVIVGAHGYNGYNGRAYIYFGGLSMDNTPDVIMTGNPGTYFGEAVSTAGDVNGDNYSDVIVGSPGFGGFTGSAYIFYGGSSMNDVPDVTIIGETGNNNLGKSVSDAGDVNGDGYPDVIVGAYGYLSGTGKVYIFYGGSAMNNIADLSLIGESAGNLFGISVSGAGDVNGDGYPDVIVGANGRGCAYIYYGGLSMDTISDIILTGESYFGSSVSGAGDVNGDGYQDVIIGAPGYSSNSGRAYVYFGGTSMNNIADVIKTGETINDRFGNSVSSAGNVNGDSYSDVIVGANGYSNNRGRAYIYKTLQYMRIDLKVIMEGMYFPIFNQMARKDTIKVYLRNASPPYHLSDSAKGTIDSLSFSGLFNFNNSPTGNYYVVVKHFNCIETWSKAGGENLIADGSLYNYDFTNSISQAYGNNLKLMGSKYCLFSGDVTQDGTINLTDLISIYNLTTHFTTGNYLPEDLTGDSIVDLTDMTLCYNNSVSFIRIIRP